MCARVPIDYERKPKSLKFKTFDCESGIQQSNRIEHALEWTNSLIFACQCVPVMMHIVCAGIFDAQHEHKYHWDSVNSSLKKSIIVRAIKQKRSTLTDNSMWSMTATNKLQTCMAFFWTDWAVTTRPAALLQWFEKIPKTVGVLCTLATNDWPAKCLQIDIHSR